MLRRMLRGMLLALRSVMRSVLQPVLHWSATVAAITAAGMLVGCGVGMSLAALSGDYVVRPSDYVSLGLRTGLFAGTVAAAWRCMTHRPPLTLRAYLATFIAITLAACAVICLLCLLALVLSPLHGLILNDANLAHPRRHVAFTLIHHLWPGAWLLGMVLGVRHLWRSRPG